MKVGKWVTAALVVTLVFSTAAMAATEQEKRQAIDDGLAWLDTWESSNATEAWWPHASNGTLAATASAALAFIEEGHYMGSGTAYEGLATKAITYVLNRVKVETNFAAEAHGYAEDYNNDGVAGNDGGNDEAIYFDPASFKRDIYTSGICAPMLYALGEKLGKDSVVGIGSAAVAGKTYSEAMQDVVDWFSYGQNDPTTGVYRGGWRYTTNQGSSDNSTAQWGALPLLYAADWGLGVPDYVKDELELWVNYIQNPNGGSGYTNPGNYVNMSKTGGLLLELAAIGAPKGDSRVKAALKYISDNWFQANGGTWYGNINHPYAMWAIFKGLQAYGLIETDPGPDGIFGTADDYLIGNGVPNAPGGFTIGQDWDTDLSGAGDWYSHYSDALQTLQNADGSWSPYGGGTWGGALGGGWYINILNATGAPPPVVDVIPEPGSLALVGVGLLGFAWIARRRRRS